MKARHIIAAPVILMLAGCTTAPSTLEPIPGSITYGGQPRTKLTKAPIGSIVEHEFNDGSRQVIETYVIEPDRSLRLATRRYRPALISFGDD